LTVRTSGLVSSATGSSGISLRALQPDAKSITHYTPSPTWISMNYMAQFTPNGANFQCSDEEKEALNDPIKLLEYSIKLKRTSDGIFQHLVFNETCQDVKKAFCANIGKLMRE
jgi:hypothetical protein